MGTKVGRKFTRFAKKAGHKLSNNSAKIGRKLSKAGRITARIAPFLSAIPLVGGPLSLAAGAASEAAGGIGGALQKRGVRGAASSLVDSYAAHRAARRS